MHDLGIEFHDIAYLDNEIWYACDNCDSPIKSFNTGGALTFHITDDIVPSAHGLTFEDDQHLWASDIYTDQLYRIDLNPESIGSSGSETNFDLRADRNPFSSMVCITAEGFQGTALISIFSLEGRMVREESFTGSYNWNGDDRNGNPVPPGTYMAVVSSPSTELGTLKLVKL